MTLPLHPPFPPMEALAQPRLPDGRNWVFEPKWDGFRCVVFKDGTSVRLQSKSGQPLERYFPEVVAAVRNVRAGGFVVDGEIIIALDRALTFDALLQRIH